MKQVLLYILKFSLTLGIGLGLLRLFCLRLICFFQYNQQVLGSLFYRFSKLDKTPFRFRNLVLLGGNGFYLAIFLAYW